ncbi:MAG: HEAT repeat domain-containing protein, partial [Candidatus Rokubacteria bacterium]|nr:HEAT repeat domain-containing protein [Candidatus Rokubacteria bacterium]
MAGLLEAVSKGDAEGLAALRNHHRDGPPSGVRNWYQGNEGSPKKESPYRCLDPRADRIPDAADQVWKRFWGWIACAEVVVHAERGDLTPLVAAARRAASLLGALAAAAEEIEPTWTSRGIAPDVLIEDGFRRLRAQGVRVGLAWDLTRHLRHHAKPRSERARPTERTVRVKLLGFEGRQPGGHRARGFLAELVLEWLPQGRGELYPDPRALEFWPLEGTFLGALETAWAYTQRQVPVPDGYDVRWWLDGATPEEWAGESLGLAAAVGLRCLVEDVEVPAGLAMSGAIDHHGRVVGVDEVDTKVAAGLAAGCWRLLIPGINQRDALDALRERPDAATSVEFVSNVLDALEAAVQLGTLRKEVTRYLEDVVRETERTRVLPGLRREVSLARLHIPVRVSPRRIRSLAKQRAEESRQLGADPFLGGLGRLYRERGEETYVAGLARDDEGRPVLWERIRLRGDSRRVVILGDPGQGKTTLLRWEAWTGAREAIGRLRQGAALSAVEVPMLERLAVAAGRMESELSMDAFLPDRLRTSPVLRQWATRRVHEGPTVMLLDALDEVHEATPRERVETHLKALVDDLGPLTRCLLTSRHTGYVSCAVERQGGRALELVLLARKETEGFVREWFGEADGARAQSCLRELRANPPLRSLGRNPLQLSLLCLAYEADEKLPERLADLYDICLTGLLQGWRVQRGLPPLSDERYRHTRQLLEDVALALWREGKEYFSGVEFIKAAETEGGSSYRALVAMEGSAWSLTGALVEDGVLVRAGREAPGVPYQFLHLTMQEYLAACALARRDDWRAIVAEWLGGFWEQQATMLVFLAGVLADVAPLLEVLLAHDDSRPLEKALRDRRNGRDPFGGVLGLAARCVAEAVAVEDRLLGELRRRAEGRVDGPKGDAAVRALAWLGRHEPRLWAAMLSHAAFAVRWAAAEALGAVGDERVVAPLLEVLTRRGDEKWVRVDAARALGELGDGRAVAPLLKVLTR